MKFKLAFPYYLLLISYLFIPHNLSANDLLAGALGKVLSRDDLQNKVEKIQATQGIDDVSKQKQIEWLQLADENIANVKWYEYLAGTYQSLLETAPKQLKQKTTTDIENRYELTANAVEKTIELQVVNLRADLRTTSDKISKLESEISKNKLRPAAIRTESLNAKKGIEESKATLNSQASYTETKQEAEAHQAYLATLINAYIAELKKIDLEAVSNSVQIQLNQHALEGLYVEQEQIKILISNRTDRLKQIRLLNDEKLAQELLKAKAESRKKHPIIQEIVSKNVQFGTDLQVIKRTISKYKQEINLLESYKQELDKNLKEADKKIKLASLSPALGRVLREQRTQLASKKLHYSQDIDLATTANGISLAQYEIELKQKKLRYLNELASEIITSLQNSSSVEIPQAELIQLKTDVNRLLLEQKKLLSELSRVYFKGLGILGDYDFLRSDVLQNISSFEHYLDERLFWVPSSLVINLQFPVSLFHSAKWFFSASHWLPVARAVVDSLQNNLLKSSFVLLFLMALVYIDKKFQNSVSVIQGRVEKVYSDKLHYTFQIILTNIIKILPIPLLLIFIAFLLKNVDGQENFIRAVGIGLQHLAISYFILQFFLKILEEKGVAQLHFSWSISATRYLYNQITWLQFIVLPCFFIIYMTASLNNTEHSDSLGRLCLIIFMLALASCFIRAAKSKESGVLDYIQQNNQSGWIRLRYLWLAAIISIPLVIVGFALTGYYLSALELQQKVIITLRVIFVAIIAYNIVIRWLSLTNRKMVLNNARKKHEAHEQSKQEAVITEEEILDIPKINQQTLKIVTVSILVAVVVSTWFVWANIFPAFSFLDNIVLWQHTVSVDNQTVIEAVTLTDLCFSMLYLFIIVTAVINFPGFMEVMLFQRANIEAGSRYAINQLAKYLMITIGFIAIANKLGGSWAQVQWLVAALTVGLGFGLQEIFANMVSGIILLFERPVRVGDTVTVDNITGTVTRIQMRATTILDWDKKELIVPNKTFITNQLINWSLTSSVTRLVIPLGISYDADVKIAYQVIKQAVIESPYILAEPEPSVIFTGFGDSSLDFSIRVYVSELDNRLPAKHDVHMRLLTALREAGIEIPFPQRDLHIRSVSEGELNVTQAGVKA